MYYIKFELSGVYFNIDKIDGNSKKKIKVQTLFFHSALRSNTCENNLFRQKFSIVSKSCKKMSPQCILVLEKKLTIANGQAKSCIVQLASILFPL